MGSFAVGARPSSSSAATAVFLRMNGYALVVSADGAERFLIDDVIVARAELVVIAAWLERFLVAR